MGIVRLIAAPIRSIMRSRLFQLAAVLAVILLLDYYSFDYAPLREISGALKTLVDATVRFFAEHFRVGLLTDPVLQVGLIVFYVYLVCLILAFLARIAIRWLVDLIGWSNFLWLRNTIAQERGIAAYRAWQPLERIRPVHIPQDKWEEAFAWPANIAALPAASPTDPARGADLRSRTCGCGNSAANFYAVPGSDLAGQNDGNIIELSV